MHADLGLGKIIEGEAQRDAIHIAIAPAVSEYKLFPGQEVKLAEGSSEMVVPDVVSPVGIVDPFLKTAVFPKQRFWLFLLPNTVTGLRHDWTHPAFKREPTSSESEAWMRQFSEQTGLSYGAVMDASREFLATGDRLVQRDSEAARDSVYDVGSELFWEHYQKITGAAINDEQKGSSPFCCSC